MPPEGNDTARRFAELVREPEARLDLARAALAIAAGAEPELEPERWLRELDRMAAGVRGLGGLRGRLFEELGFAGNSQGYYDPENSFLHRVIERRLGIPITLSVLAMEVGRRAGIELVGIGMPGHFLVRVGSSGPYLDAFYGGQVLDEAGCEARFRAATGAGPDVAFGPHLLPVVSKHRILDRMLANLRAIYRARSSGEDLEWVLRMRLALPHVERSEAAELGEAVAMQGRFREGAEEIERHAEGDGEASEPLLAAARALRARLN